ncbi:hypothetical protein K445DRAFT_315369 [Daldinia sp. EC12]|nr:hypothetical protein K445DRAFT_315369 [Daldinia sp. EC12]
MAVAAFTTSCASATRDGFGQPKNEPSIVSVALQWDELDLQTRLELISRAWLSVATVLTSVRVFHLGHFVP